MSRTQYCFDLSGIKFKSSAEIQKMKNQWDTFERIENENAQIFQRFMAGYQDKGYHHFSNRQELEDYRRGQALHIARYPWLSTSTFDPISERPIPSNIEVLARPSYFGQISRCVPEPKPISQTELAARQNDLATYAYVSTFNATHVYKYNFKDAEERLAYHRAEQRVLAPDSV